MLNDKENNIKSFFLRDEDIDKVDLSALMEKLETLKNIRYPNDDDVDLHSIRNSIEKEINMIFEPRNTITDSNSDHEEWFNVGLKKDWSQFGRYKRFYQDEVSIVAAEEMDKSTDDIIKNLDDPKRDSKWDRRGLVIGYVQSGKTANYIGVINKAIAAGYKVIVVLASRTENLRFQTQQRIDDGVLGRDSGVEKGKPKKICGVGRYKEYKTKNVNSVTTVYHDFKRDAARIFDINPQEDPIILVSKKHVSILENINNWINTTLVDNAKRKKVEKIPLLLIDDESDDASIDTTTREKDIDNNPVINGISEVDPTRTNLLIRKMLNSFDKSSYIAYSATPFANCITYEGGLSEDSKKEEDKIYGENLYPRDFISVIPKSNEYVDWKALDIDPETEEKIPNKTFVTDFVDDEDVPSIGWMPSARANRTDHIPLYKGEDVCPPSLKKAIRSFIMAVAISQVKKQTGPHTMLIHASRVNNPQVAIYKQVLKYRDEIKADLGGAFLDIKDSTTYKEMQDLWDNDFKNTVKDSNISFEKIIKEITYDEEDSERRLLEFLQPIMIVGQNIGDRFEDDVKELFDLDKQLEQKKHVIVIGGDKLTRGLTLLGLKTSYFLRDAREIQIDTFTQMSRWFGYRKEYLDLIRLFFKRQMMENYTEMANWIEDTMEELTYMNNNNNSPESVGVWFKDVHHGLRITSRQKAQYEQQRSQIYYNRTFGSNSLDKSENIDSNLSAVENFINKIGNHEDRKNNFMWSLDDNKLVCDFLEKYKVSKTSKEFIPRRIGHFLQEQSAPVFKTWKIILIDGGRAKKWKFKNINNEINCSLRKNSSHTPDIIYRVQSVTSKNDYLLDLDDYEDLIRRNITAKEANQSYRKDHCSLHIYPVRPDTDHTGKPYIACFIQIPLVDRNLIVGAARVGRGGNQAGRQATHN